MNGAYNIPMDDQAEAMAIQRRMKMADLLRQQAMTAPEGHMVGKQLVAPNPLQHVSRLMGAMMANRQESGAMDMANQYADAKRQRIANALANVGDLSQPGALYKAGLGLLNDNPQLAGQFITGGIGNDRMVNQFAHQDKAQERMIQARDEEAVQARMDAEVARQDQREWMSHEKELDRQARLGAGGQGGAAHVSSILNSGKYGQILIMSDGTARVPGVGVVPIEKLGPEFTAPNPLVKPSDDPARARKLEEEKAAGKAVGEATAKRDYNMAGLGSMIDDADALLGGKDPATEKALPKPTHSLLGTGVDALAGVFGATTGGAETADRLEALSGALVSKMPRMEGPQSNFDVENYRVMAGRVGDRTLPVERRRAALKEVERLWRKYDKADTAPQDAGGLSTEEQAELNALRQRYPGGMP